MGSPQSPSATPTFPATITPPVNGDNLSATTLNTDVETPLQNGVEAARMLTYGGGPRRRVVCTSNSVMVIQPLGAVVATVAGVNTVVPWTTGAATIDPDTLAGGLAANTRYWVYATAVLSAGAGSPPVFVVSTNAPDAALKYSSASSDQMYVSTFYTDATPDILLYSQNDNEYDYSTYGTGNRVLNAGSAVVQTTVSFTGPCPSQASAARVRAQWAASVIDVVSLRDVTSGNILWSWETTATGATSMAYIPHSLVDGNRIAYLCGLNTSVLTLHIAGFTL